MLTALAFNHPLSVDLPVCLGLEKIFESSPALLAPASGSCPLIKLFPPFKLTGLIDRFDDFAVPFIKLRGPVGGVAPTLLVGD